MKKITLLLLITVCIVCSVAHAQSIKKGIRTSLADQDYQIAQKAYRILKRDFGGSAEGPPEAEVNSTCQKIQRALYSNQHELTSTDVFRQRELKKQISDLNGYAEDLKCPPKR